MMRASLHEQEDVQVHCRCWVHSRWHNCVSVVASMNMHHQLMHFRKHADRHFLPVLAVGASDTIPLNDVHVVH